MGTLSNLKVFCGKKICMIIHKGIDNIGNDLKFTLSDGSVVNPIFNKISVSNKNIYYYAMAILIDNLHRLVDQFEEVIGKIPTPRPYRNRPICVEVAYIREAGLAHHGISGIACGPAYLRYFYDSCIAYLQNNTELPKFEHIFTYELCRNYIFPEFSQVFD